MRAYIMFITAVWVSAYADDVDVCHQVHLMSDYCISYGETGSGIGGSGSIQIFEEKLDIKLKEMEERLRQSLGEPPEVNYTFVEEVINERFQGVEDRVIQELGEPPKVNYTAVEEMISIRFERLEAQVNGGDEGGTSIVDYAKIFERIDQRYTEIRAYVDAKFAQLINDTEAYQDAVDSMDRLMNVSDCREINQKDAKLCNATGGVFDIYRGLKKYEVFCDSYTDGGGWTVFHRNDGTNYNFTRSWKEYEEGFGKPQGNFWLGLKKLHELLSNGNHELRIDFMDSTGRVRYVKYGIFYVGGKSTKYALSVQSFSGELQNNIVSGIPFSTFDHDNDNSRENCAEDYKGGWWHTRMGAWNCGYSMVTGNYWYTFDNIVRTEMKFRRLPVE